MDKHGRPSVVPEGEELEDVLRELDALDGSAEGLHFVRSHLVVEGRLDQLEGVGAQLDSLLQHLLHFRQILVYGETLLFGEGGDGEEPGDGVLGGERVHRGALEYQSVVGEE